MSNKKAIWAGVLWEIGRWTVSCTLVVLVACSTFSQKHTEDKDRVEAARLAIMTNQLDSASQAGQMVYATGVALDKTTSTITNNPALALAQQLNERAQLILGVPDLQDALALRKMVEDLLVTQCELQQRGKEELALRDARIIQLQNQKGTLEQKLSGAEDKRDRHYAQAAVSADKWEHLMGWVHKILWTLGILAAILVGVNVAALAYPPLLPLASILNNLTGGVVGFFFGAFCKLIPQTCHHAGVVPREEHEDLQRDHDLSETTVAHLVSAIEELKITKPGVFADSLRPILIDHTSRETSAKKIKSVQADLKNV